MKALVLKETNQYPTVVHDHPQPSASNDEVVVKLSYAALNRRDYWITQGQYPNIKLPVIMGSDGAGTLDGKPVLIYPASGWGDRNAVQSEEFEPLGMPKDGTIAEYIAIDKNYVFDAPDYLTSAEAGCVGMAGLTAYRALFSRAKIKRGERVLINGVGGGVALMACQLALANSCEVHVTSGHDEKIEAAKKMGAQEGYNYRDEKWYKKPLESNTLFDVIVDSAGGKMFNNLVKVAAPGGRIVTYGGTHGSMEKVNTQIIFWRQLSILGSTMGSPTEFGNLLKFMTKHQIRPIIHKLYHWDSTDAAFDALRDSTQFGKLVFSLE